jgi:hypothetical protein
MLCRGFSAVTLNSSSTLGTRPSTVVEDDKRARDEKTVQRALEGECVIIHHKHSLKSPFLGLHLPSHLWQGGLDLSQLRHQFVDPQLIEAA